ncbi:MAG: phosphoribosylamine--glycine ligase [Dehalococcoidia bacterium]|nr:phosphoribosylamine--glycine ligase [Dehalococcoidia bacterium]
MRLLVIGGGAREHSLVWQLLQSPKVDKIYVAPGNAGTQAIAHNLNISASDIEALADAAEELSIDLTIVGPEIPLAMGIADLFQERGLSISGPSRAAAQMESSKDFAKRLMRKHCIPCAKGVTFSSFAEAQEYLIKQEIPVVIKANGLAAGKGVIIAQSMKEALSSLSDIMVGKKLGSAGDKILIEECLFGKEVSLIAFTDGKTIIPMVPACDYKRALDNDMGANTGGMGTYSPPGFFDRSLLDLTVETILKPTIQALAQEGISYKGVLYAGLMLTADGPKVLEFNVRFGDPETQVVLRRLNTPLVDILLAINDGTLDKVNIEWSDNACVGVVMASGGYPNKYKSDFPVSGLDKVDNDIIVFHAGTKLKKGQVVTSGGRVLTVTAMGKDIAEARTKVYKNIPHIDFQGKQYRKDIAAREVR